MTSPTESSHLRGDSAGHAAAEAPSFEGYDAANAQATAPFLSNVESHVGRITLTAPDNIRRSRQRDKRAATTRFSRLVITRPARASTSNLRSAQTERGARQGDPLAQPRPRTTRLRAQSTGSSDARRNTPNQVQSWTRRLSVWDDVNTLLEMSHPDAVDAPPPFAVQHAAPPPIPTSPPPPFVSDPESEGENDTHISQDRSDESAEISVDAATLHERDAWENDRIAGYTLEERVARMDMRAKAPARGTLHAALQRASRRAAAPRVRQVPADPTAPRDDAGPSVHVTDPSQLLEPVRAPSPLHTHTKMPTHEPDISSDENEHEEEEGDSDQDWQNEHDALYALHCYEASMQRAMRDSKLQAVRNESVRTTQPSFMSILNELEQSLPRAPPRQWARTPAFDTVHTASSSSSEGLLVSVSSASSQDTLASIETNKDDDETALANGPKAHRLGTQTAKESWVAMAHRAKASPEETGRTAFSKRPFARTSDEETHSSRTEESNVSSGSSSSPLAQTDTAPRGTAAREARLFPSPPPLPDKDVPTSACPAKQQSVPHETHSLSYPPLVSGPSAASSKAHPSLAPVLQAPNPRHAPVQERPTPPTLPPRRRTHSTVHARPLPPPPPSQVPFLRSAFDQLRELQSPPPAPTADSTEQTLHTLPVPEFAPTRADLDRLEQYLTSRLPSNQAASEAQAASIGLSRTVSHYGGAFTNPRSSAAPLPSHSRLPTITAATRHFPPTRTFAPDMAQPSAVPTPYDAFEAVPQAPRRSTPPSFVRDVQDIPHELVPGHSSPAAPPLLGDASAPFTPVSPRAPRQAPPPPSASQRVSSRSRVVRTRPARALQVCPAGTTDIFDPTLPVQPIATQLLRNPLVERSPSSASSEAPRSDSSAQSRESEEGITDLDLAVAHLDDPDTHYEIASLLGDFLGPASVGSVLTQEQLQNINVSRVELEYRRVLPSGKVKQKLSVAGVRVDRCGICLAQFREGQMVCILPCFHMFHNECTVQLVRSSKLCPNCRHDISLGPV
ncbi:hypothetical protein MVES1_000969 [Malassezia vespertilionis]|uniref:RING-type domain-containing protein n=1 Tax=Malassezia vespertilionis TaxID=2020962 RepID=A0A2N1JEG4_9BASI|nr:uncharacterized protein MVES1_000969 [Malassezia vespertilionis]PKI84941.1 hypothetical protein MVES_000910 [Malassezia vespertilionis]WFD05637.1 hypothetical protein MVES1_000969 [Malassezia vespertilionis]